MKLFDILCEADIVNIKDEGWEREPGQGMMMSVARWLEDWQILGADRYVRVPPEQLKAVLKKIRNLAINDPAVHEPVQIKPKSPEWSRESFDKGTLFAFNSMDQRVNEIIRQALLHLGEAGHHNDTRLFTAIMHTRSFADIKRAVDNYVDALEVELNRKNPGGELFVADLGEYILVQLMSKAACEREGAVMQNCIETDYDPKNMDHGHHLYIIKTKDTKKAVVSFEVFDGKVDQLTGKQNARPEYKYQDAIDKAFDHLHVYLAAEDEYEG